MTTLLAFTLPLLVLVAVIALKRVTAHKACAICVAVSVTWSVLLVFFFGLSRGDPLLIALFMGGSAVGLMYYLMARLPERFRIFLFPYILSAFFAILLILRGWRPEYRVVALVLLGYWLGFALVYALRHQSAIGQTAQRIIACCRDW